MRKRGGVTLESDLSDKSDVSDKIGASWDNPRVCGAAVLFCSGRRGTVEYAWQLDGNGGMLSAVA